MRRLLLMAALLVAGAAPAWAQSDSRWVAIFAPEGTIGKGGDRYGDPNEWMGKTPHVVETIFRRMGVPYKVILLPDSAGGWARQIGDTRDTDEADSTHFRKNGCMGWVSFMNAFSVGTSLKTFTGEIRGVFTDAEGNRGVQQGCPLDGNWGIPGVMFIAGSPVAGGTLLSGIASTYGVSGHARNRSLFVNGDSLSTDNTVAYLPAAGEAANFTPIINTPDYDASGDSLPVSAWRYKTNTLYYSVTVDPYMDPKMILLGLADLFQRAGYSPRRKLNLHTDLDHPYPDATVETAPSESLFRYLDAFTQWRFGGAIEAHASETTGGLNPDDPVLAAMWKSRSSRWPGDPHSHQYMNFYPNSTTWNLTTFADSATKRARWNELRLAIKDTIQHAPARGYEMTATFPDNNVYFPDLFIMASGGYRDIRSKAFAAASTVDSTGTPASVNLRRWQQVPGPRTFSNPLSTYGLPYGYIEPKTNRLLYVHDSVENPTSSDSLSTAATDFSVSMEGFASRNLSSMCRMAIWDGGYYWHPDINVTRGRFMADFYRRFSYFYARVKNILEVTPVYHPKTPRVGGTARP